ncbi:Heat shock 70 kDa protein 1, partial [Diplonema papillatum]
VITKNYTTKMSFGVCIGNDSVSIAVYQDEPVIVVNQAGHRVTAAAVSFSEGEVVVGDTAKGIFVKRGPRQVLHTIPYIFAHTEDVSKVRAKRLGVELSLDESENIAALMAFSDNGDESSQKVTFEEVFTHIFRFCKREVESYLGTSVTGCVVVLDDALCDNASSVATVAKAADAVGLEVERIMRPCTASLLAALPSLDPGTENDKLVSQKILVVDMGALHTTTTAVCCEQGMVSIVSRESVDFGGRDCDAALYKHFAEEFRRKAKIDLADDKRAQRKLLHACEEAKKTMTTRGEGLIQIEALSQGIDFSSKIARGRYESLISKFMPTAVSSASKCLQASKFSKPDVIVFIGGASNTVTFRNQIHSTFGSEIPVIAKTPEEIVVMGAAIQSHVCS